MSYILSIYLSRTIIGLGCFLIYEIVKKWYLLIDLCLHVFQKCPQNLMNVKKWQISEPDEIFYMIVCQLFNVYLQKIIIHKYFHFMGSYYLHSGSDPKKNAIFALNWNFSTFLPFNLESWSFCQWMYSWVHPFSENYNFLAFIV